MPLILTWQDIALRLALTVIAAALFGLDRRMRGRAAGLRTMILVGLASAAAMIQMNQLLPVVGKTAQSFSVMDVMRLPLGILTGVGFIGGGVILKRGDLVTGVTTAAALWLVAVVGLCFGGGQLGIGVAASALGAATIHFAKWFEDRLPREQKALVTLVADRGAPEVVEFAARLKAKGFHARLIKQTRAGEPPDLGARLDYEIVWRGAANQRPDELLRLFDKTAAVTSLELLTEID